MLESTLEKNMRLAVQALGGFCIKLNPAWNIGIPDRLCVIPGRVIFVELKKPKTGRLSGTQKFWRNKLMQLGCEYWLINSEAKILEMLHKEKAAGL